MNAVNFHYSVSTWKGKIVEQYKNKIVLLSHNLLLSLTGILISSKILFSELKSKYYAPDKMVKIYTANTKNTDLSFCMYFHEITYAYMQVGIITLVNSLRRELLSSNHTFKVMLDTKGALHFFKFYAKAYGRPDLSIPLFISTEHKMPVAKPLLIRPALKTI